MGLIRRWLNLPTFSERLVERLLDQNQQLLDRLLWKEGIPPTKPLEASKPEVSPATQFQEFTQNRLVMIEQLAREAAGDPELMGQAKDNATYSEDWAEVVERAEAMMEEVM